MFGHQGHFWRGTARTRVLTLGLIAAVALPGCGPDGGRAVAGPAMGEAQFKAPFDVPHAASAASRGRAGAASCPAPGVPLRSLEVNTRYRPGKAADSVSPEAEEAYREAMAPVIAFMASSANNANRYIRSGGADVAAADCARGALAQWAAGDAFAQVSGSAGWFKLSTILSGLSLTYLQIRDAPTDEAGREANHRIELWLARMASALLDYRLHQVSGTPVHNNHLYWAGLGIGAAGAAVGNREFFDFGMKAFDEGACAVTSDGYLPLELKRGNAALHYHVYALHPLMLLAELAQRNGHSGFEACGGGLRRLAENVLAGAENPANFEQRAGAKQKPVLGQGQDLPKTLWGWLAIYARHATLAPNWQQRLNATSRLAAAETGGDEITLYFRTRDR